MSILTYDIYTIEFRGKYTGTIYKTLETTVYKEALKLSKLYLPTVEEINDIEAYALIKKNGRDFAEIRWYEIGKCFKEKMI